MKNKPVSTSILSSVPGLEASNGSLFTSSSSESVLSSLSVLPELLGHRARVISDLEAYEIGNSKAHICSADLGRLCVSGPKVTSFSSQMSSSSEPGSSNCWIFSLQRASNKAMFAWTNKHAENRQYIYRLPYKRWSMDEDLSLKMLSLVSVY